MQIFARKGKRSPLKGILTLSIDPSLGPLLEDSFPYGFTSSPLILSALLELFRWMSLMLKEAADEHFKYFYLEDFGIIGMIFIFKEDAEKWLSIIALFNSDASTVIWKKREKIIKSLRSAMKMLARGEPRSKVLERLYDELLKIK
ncbi:MAG: hypothetical protein ACTSXJ_09110 [Candidatus Baldrarchaeia archaeon]